MKRCRDNLCNLQTVGHWMLQKFCVHSYTGYRRNSATTRTLGVAEILQPFIHWMLQKFSTTCTLGVAEVLRHNFSPVQNNFKRFLYVMNRAQIYHLNLAWTWKRSQGKLMLNYLMKPSDPSLSRGKMLNLQNHRF